MIEENNADIASIVGIDDTCAHVYRVLPGQTRTRSHSTITATRNGYSDVCLNLMSDKSIKICWIAKLLIFNTNCLPLFGTRQS